MNLSQNQRETHSAPTPKNGERTEILKGLKLSATAGLGYVPLGIALGVLIEQSTLPWWMGLALSVFAYAGSLEFLLVGLIGAATPLLTIAIATFFINFRHVFYAFTFPLKAVKNPLLKLYSMHALTDEAYALTAAFPDSLSGKGWKQSGLLALQLSLHLLWIVGVMLGLLLSSLIPGSIAGVEFALVAMFIVLALEAAKTKKQVPSVLIGVGCFGLALVLVPQQPLFAAMIFFCVALALRYLISLRLNRSASKRGAHA